MNSTKYLERTEVIAAEPMEAAAAMLNMEISDEHKGHVPAMWHWFYLLDRHKQEDLGEDGHSTIGIPVAPSPGSRRMFGGGRVTTRGLLQIGVPATKRTSILSSVEKQGKHGSFMLVTVLQEIYQHDELVIREEQDIIYRSEESESLDPPQSSPEPPTQQPVVTLDVDAALLFRFSALTYNAHRIHYDLDWCHLEGYQDLVIHGPLLAFMMAQGMQQTGLSFIDKSFSYRLVSPMIGPQKFSVVPTNPELADGAQALSQDNVVCAVSKLIEA